MKFSLILAALLLVASPARADLPISLVLMDVDSPAKAVITDPHGQPLPEAMPLGEMVVFSFRKSVYGGRAESIKVIIEPEARAARSYFSDDMLTAYVPTGLTPVEIKCTLIVAKGDVPDFTSIRVRCGEGPIPPPVPPDPKPGPETTTEAAARTAIKTYAANISKAFGDAATARHADAAKANAALGTANKAARESAFVPIDRLIDAQIGGNNWEPAKAAALFGELSAAFMKAGR